MPTNDKDLPLREDTRLLGRLLGDTVREQEGDDVFAAVERIRDCGGIHGPARYRCAGCRRRNPGAS